MYANMYIHVNRYKYANMYIHANMHIYANKYIYANMYIYAKPVGDTGRPSTKHLLHQRQTRLVEVLLRSKNMTLPPVVEWDCLLVCIVEAIERVCFV